MEIPCDTGDENEVRLLSLPVPFQLLVAFERNELLLLNRDPSAAASPVSDRGVLRLDAEPQ